MYNAQPTNSKRTQRRSRFPFVSSRIDWLKQLSKPLSLASSSPLSPWHSPCPVSPTIRHGSPARIYTRGSIAYLFSAGVRAWGQIARETNRPAHAQWKGRGKKYWIPSIERGYIVAAKIFLIKAVIKRFLRDRGMVGTSLCVCFRGRALIWSWGNGKMTIGWWRRCFGSLAAVLRIWWNSIRFGDWIEVWF